MITDIRTNIVGAAWLICLCKWKPRYQFFDITHTQLDLYQTAQTMKKYLIRNPWMME